MGCNGDSDSSSTGLDEDGGSEPVVISSRVTGLELGVSDLDLSLPVYRDGLGMALLSDTTTANSRQVTLASPNSRFEATLTLIEFTDGLGRNLVDNPGKLVFFTPNASDLANRFATAGGMVTLPPADQPGFGVVGFGRDPDNNLIELTEVPQLPFTLLGAVGIGASNLDHARDFYRDQVGLTERQFIATASYDEYIMGSPEGQSSLSLVLMHWTDGIERRYAENVTRLRLRSDDPETLVGRTYSEQGGRPVDPDGNWLMVDATPVNQAGSESSD